ncbi:MAG: WXG100 family type VII secretion target [Bacillota bacterium]
MGRIKVYPDELRSASGEFYRCGEDLQALGDRVNAIVRGMGWETRVQLHLVGRTGEAHAQARELADRLAGLARVLAQKAEAFEQADHASEPVPSSQQFAAAARSLIPSLPPLARMDGVSQYGLEKLVSLGLLGAAPAAGGVTSNLLPVGGTARVDGYLRQRAAPPEEGLAAALPGALGLMALGNLIGRKQAIVGGQSTGIPGMTLARTQIKGTDGGPGISAQVDALHMQRTLARGVTAEASVGRFKAEVQGINLKEAIKNKKFEAKVAAEASLLHGEVNANLFKNDVASVDAKAEGDVLGASGTLKAGTQGVEASGYAYVAEGEVSTTFKIFDWGVKLGVRGCAACVGGGVKMDWAGNSGEIGLAAALGGRVFWDID